MQVFPLILIHIQVEFVGYTESCIQCHDHDIFIISAAADSSLSLAVLGGVLGSLLLIALLIIVGLIILLFLKKQSKSKQ